MSSWDRSGLTFSRCKQINQHTVFVSEDTELKPLVMYENSENLIRKKFLKIYIKILNINVSSSYAYFWHLKDYSSRAAWRFDLKFNLLLCWVEIVLVYINRLLFLKLHSSIWNCHFLFETGNRWLPFIFCISCRWQAQHFGLQWHGPVSKEEGDSYE